MRYALPLWLRGVLDRVDQEMMRAGYRPSDRKTHIAHLRRFYLARDRPTPACTSEEMRSWLVCLHRLGHSRTYMAEALSAIRFVHEQVLREPPPVASIPFSRAS